MLPQGLLSSGCGALAEVRLPFGAQGLLNRTFARLAGVEVDESEGSPDEYRSLSSFFSRPLRPGARTFPSDPAVAVSPADGIVGAHGRLTEGVALQAKGLSYSVGHLLGDANEVERFRDGVFLTIYLSPRHYHRVHAPAAGTLVRARSIPGRLLPVNLAAVRSIADLFPRNERLVALLKLDPWHAAIVAVGAFNVGRISVAFDSDWNRPDGRGVTNRRARRWPETRHYRPALAFARGDEMMTFHLGSTVVLLLGADSGRVPVLSAGLKEGNEIRIGTPILEGGG